jgi:hypothetical protein
MDRLHTANHLALAAAMAEPTNQPGASFAALHALAEVLVGARMFTVLAFDFPRNFARRLYSTQEAIYPVGVDDPIADTIWEQTLIGRRQPLVLNDRAALATLLPNTEELAALGCDAMLNQPVVVAGQTIGALNMLHQAGHYTPERVAAAQALSPAAAAILLSIAMQGQ